jgi:hypothetical protein
VVHKRSGAQTRPASAVRTQTKHGTSPGSLRRAEKQIRELSLGLQAAEQKIQSLNAKTGTLHHDHGTDAQGSGQPAPLSTLDILRGAQRFYPSDTYKN